MIVRNEERVIGRCLEAIKPHIHSWSICDTGSDDKTMEIIEESLQGIPGALYQEPWKNFGHNRNLAFQHAKDHGDYALIIDADDIFTTNEGFAWPDPLGDRGYDMTVTSGGSSYFQSRLLSTKEDWHWKGVVHEYPTLGYLFDTELIREAKIVSMPDGNRRMMDPKIKYAEDARAIEKALEDDPDNPRYLFYLGQSYRDSHQYKKAYEAYLRRIEVGGWDEETWYAKFQLGRLHEMMGDSWDHALVAYLEAYRFRPSRIEPLVAITRHCRMRDEHHLAYVFAAQAAYAPKPPDRLFMDAAAYEWFALDEYAICCYWIGKHEEAIRANERLLRVGPKAQHARFRGNIAFSEKALGVK